MCPLAYAAAFAVYRPADKLAFTKTAINAKANDVDFVVVRLQPAHTCAACSVRKLVFL